MRRHVDAHLDPRGAGRRRTRHRRTVPRVGQPRAGRGIRLTVFLLLRLQPVDDHHLRATSRVDPAADPDAARSAEHHPPDAGRRRRALHHAAAAGRAGKHRAGQPPERSASSGSSSEHPPHWRDGRLMLSFSLLLLSFSSSSLPPFSSFPSPSPVRSLLSSCTSGLRRLVCNLSRVPAGARSTPPACPSSKPTCIGCVSRCALSWVR